ncbi:MAG: ribosome small subunit-dependent GTPase A [candidate division KSB1 bacterium]|nr:ribosome small subunit-dependent GTPase A [candidate division KSB1 bacterium]MDZ7275565.1 ribosome small subunit-dependent GTPase A [candidate division KSB1 bacterium]MDZ7286123.1 ribosome small subunit-dependent GTPase A [candidate division KSB1 bacterium]MDZ7296349.1 ribosome small subunit-dependent GTPase A [candidate division KSB1 bacterium]MDZ7307125.1 ribosome small subunit-dependent GTPase A [candidate division KSB1 bacterium]
MKDLTRIEQKQLRHLWQERRERLQAAGGEEETPASNDSSASEALRETLIHQAAPHAEQLVLVQSVQEPPFSHSQIDRGLILAQIEVVEPLICLTKLDLAANRGVIDKAVRLYRELGYAIVLTSAKTGEGIAGLRERLENKHSLLIGDAGVGRKSLLAQLDSGYDKRCRTEERMLEAGNGAAVRCRIKHCEFPRGVEITMLEEITVASLLGLQPDELRFYYNEFREFSGDCAAAECLHWRESACAVKQAMANGEIARPRYQAYVDLLQSLTR